MATLKENAVEEANHKLNVRRQDEREDPADLNSFTVLQTNWSAGAQQYMKPHIIAAIDTNPGSLTKASEEVRTAHLREYGGTVAVVLAKGANSWASKTNFYYYAVYKGVYIGVWSSD